MSITPPFRIPGSTPLLAGALLVSISACGSTGATLGAGVGESYLEHAPWYAGRTTEGPSAVGHLPVLYQRGAAHAPIFDPAAGPALNGLLAEMTAHLDALALSVRLAEGGPVSAVSHADTRVPPDVHFGCVPEHGLPGEDCAEPDDEMTLGRDAAHWLAVGRPSPEWAAWAAGRMDDLGVEAALVVTLEVGWYPIQQRGLRGTKVVELGTDHEVTLPWLTSLETPVAVLQLTGVLVGRDGRAIRIGAEGLVARRTPLLASAVGATALIDDEDVASLATARREDLPAAPLVWEVALETLARRLVGSSR